MFRICVTVAGLLLVTGSAVGQTGNLGDAANERCWKAWVDFRMKDVPKADDTVSPSTGKEMSQTSGARLTRKKKYEAKLSELELRGKEDPIWKTYLLGCLKG